jgi:demethylmenaquinone methyltransferase/2-methoxy-6-polyprenyl-1,4-benzoquinol methylase
MKKLAGMFEEAGFKNVTYIPYTGGVAAAHFGYKQK